jgi:uncharacterized protein YcaQ
VVWDRERALAMFGFDYRLECYVPARKRRHGYFVLPILRRGVLVGRLDAKAQRAPRVSRTYRSLSCDHGPQRALKLLGRQVVGSNFFSFIWFSLPALPAWLLKR